MNKNNAKLQMAINLLNAGKPLQGLMLIIQVYESNPEDLDPVSIATMPLYRSIVKKVTASMTKENDDWESNISN